MSEASRERERLLALLRRDGILRSTPQAPITHRNGEIAPWAFYSWGLSLSQDGLRLAARELLRLLGGFGSTQIASYGYTGLPLLAACVLEGGGRYTGLSIRETRKPYLTNRRIDGAVDPGRPVVVIDDSLSSGTSLHKAIVALEDEGLEVEGTAALVHFPFRGAKAWANAAGYRTATAFDIWRDLGMADPPLGYTGRGAGRPAVGGDPLPEGLAPAALARLAAREFLRTGQTPRWPARLDATYDARGGTFVSFRRRRDDHRLARDGFWHFDPAEAEPARDVVLATVDTLWRNPGAVSLDMISTLKIGVTFFGPLEHVSPAGLDFDRYGIVARSELWPDKLGGSLPNTQVFISDIEQYRHARATNARIDDGEPHALYRHTLSKHTEPGEAWLPYGQAEGAQTGWWRDRAIGARLAARARQLLDGSSGIPLPYDLIPCAIEGVAVALYAGGLRGYGLAHGRDLDQALGEAVEVARRDPRYAAGADVDVVVSVLHHGEDHGASRAMAEKKLRRGLDALTRYGAGRPVTVLPGALVLNAWTPAQLFDAAEALAGASGPAANWRTAQVAAWLSAGDEIRPLRFGFPARDSTPLDDAGAAQQAELMAGYIRRAMGRDGLPAYRLAANLGDYERTGTAGRVIHGLYSLLIAGRAAGRPDWTEAARGGIATALATVGYGGVVLPDHMGGPLADAVLLAAASEAGLASSGAAALLAERVAGFVRPSGWVGAGAKRLDNPQDQEFLPGAAVWALSAWSAATGAPPHPHLAAARRHYGGRFDDTPGWGSPWLAQGWGAAHALSGDAQDAALVFRVADWLCALQLDANGAFLEELSVNEPSFNTGFVAEGIAAAWRTAWTCRDAKRAGRYEASWRRAMGFIRTLTLQPGDGFAFPRPAPSVTPDQVRGDTSPVAFATGEERAVGGVRCTLSRGDIRIDQVSHSLHALVEGRACVGGAVKRKARAA